MLHNLGCQHRIAGASANKQAAQAAPTSIKPIKPSALGSSGLAHSNVRIYSTTLLHVIKNQRHPSCQSHRPCSYGTTTKQASCVHQTPPHQLQPPFPLSPRDTGRGRVTRFDTNSAAQRALLSSLYMDLVPTGMFDDIHNQAYHHNFHTPYKNVHMQLPHESQLSNPATTGAKTCPSWVSNAVCMPSICLDMGTRTNPTPALRLQIQSTRLKHGPSRRWTL